MRNNETKKKCWHFTVFTGHFALTVERSQITPCQIMCIKGEKIDTALTQISASDPKFPSGLEIRTIRNLETTPKHTAGMHNVSYFTVYQLTINWVIWSLSIGILEMPLGSELLYFRTNKTSTIIIHRDSYRFTLIFGHALLMHNVMVNQKYIVAALLFKVAKWQSQPQLSLF